MTFPEALQAHKGGLVRIKSDLFWYGGRGWDGVHDRICLLLNAAGSPPSRAPRAAPAMRRSEAPPSSSSTGLRTGSGSVLATWSSFTDPVRLGSLIV
jgi:hypothetical protein